MGALAFDHAEEALGRCVGSAVTHGTHAAQDVVIGEELLLGSARNLRTSVGVQHQELPIRALHARHQQGFDRHVAIAWT